MLFMRSKFIHNLKRFAFLWIPILVFIIVGFFVYLAGLAGSGSSTNPLLDTSLHITPLAPLPEGTIQPYPPVNSLLLQYADQSQSQAQRGIMQVYGSSIPPVGAYLPRSGVAQFELGQATPLPTPLPYPTSPPLPLPALPGQIIPTVPVVDANGQARILPYTGEECAPSGNPVDGILTQRFHGFHSGIDIGIPLSTAVIATHSGTVIYADWSDVGYGYLVIIQNARFITYYAHNTSFNVTRGVNVGKGSIIAWSGSTGNSSGPHVHYETRIDDVPVDPLTFSARRYNSC